MRSPVQVWSAAPKQRFRRNAVFLYSCIQRMQEYKSTVFFAKNRAELLAPALLQIKILRAFLCIRLSSSAAVNHSIVKKMFWVVAFIYILAYNACKDIKARFLLKPCGAAGACATANKNTMCFSLHPLVFISSGESLYRKENVLGSRFFYILAYNACKNIKARFLLKPCGAAGDIARRLRILRALIVFACLHQQSNG